MVLRKILCGLLLIFISSFSVGAGRAFFFPKANLTKDAFDLVRAKGDPDAPLWVVEYFDYQCPACRRAYFLLKDAVKENPSKIYLQARFFPLVMHKYGLKASLYASAAAAQGKFWSFHDVLFEKQTEWSRAPEESIDTLFENYAKSVGIDPKELAKAVADPGTKQRVFDENEKAKSLGVRITPSFFINGKLVAGFDAFKEAMGKFFTIKETVPA